MQWRETLVFLGIPMGLIRIIDICFCRIRCGAVSQGPIRLVWLMRSLLLAS